MPPKKELCRNFMRGSCQYGARCRYLHAAQTPSTGFGVQNGNFPQQSNLQQQKPNPFGFGIQNGNQSQRSSSEEQKSNPFGFGVQTNSQPRGGFSDFGSRQNQSKPFQNKWIRPSQTNVGDSSASRQPDNPSASHKCTDSESCKTLIVEDFKNENPLWKLTCYGHAKNGPCDIVGDVSYEELRTAAYDDAKHGLNLQAIVEKERTLLNAKLAEFDALIRNPRPVIPESNKPPFSSLSHLGTSLSGATSPPTNFFGQSHSFQNSPTPGSFGGQLVSQTPQNSFGFGRNSTGFGNISPSTKQNQIFPTVSPLTQISKSAGDLFSGSPSGGLAMVNANLDLNTPAENLDGDDSIWTTDRWTIGKIPESAPPVKYCR